VLRRWWTRVGGRHPVESKSGHSSVDEPPDETRTDAAGGMPSPSGDESVDTRAGDRLGRRPFAEAIAAQIASVDAHKAVVFGVVGPWGSGKTSLLKMAGESLREDHGAVVLWFNPWMFSGTQHLVGIFFAELGAQLSDMRERPWQELGSAMREFGVTLATLRSIPVAGRWLKAGGEGLQRGGGRLEGAADEGASLLERRRRLEEALAGIGELGKKIVIMVDDLDRLRWQEIRDVVALVRLNADLPNLSFVLAYDRGRVEQALGEAEGDGRAYLEKIVQVVHDVPKGHDVDLSKELVDAINGVLGSTPITGPFNEQRFWNVFHAVIRPLVGSVRDVRRYANALPVTFRVVGDEVDVTDVLALEAMRVLLPEAFAALSESADALTTPSDQLGTLSGRSDPRLEAARTKIEAFARSGGPQEKVTREARSRLFPASMWADNNHYGSDWLKTWSKERRVAHPRVLAFYLEKRLPDGILPARDVQELFEALGDRERLGAVLGAMDPDTLEDALERLEDYEDDYRPGDVEAAVPVLLNQMPRLREGSRGFMDFGAGMKLRRVVLRLLRKVEDPTALATLVKVAASRIETLSARATLVEMVGHRENVGHRLVTEDEASLLEAQLLTAMEHTPPQDLARERDLVRLLYLAQSIDPGRGTALVGRLAERDEVFLAVLRGLRREVHSSSIGDRVSRTDHDFGWEALCNLFGEETARRRVSQLARAVGSGATEGGLDDETQAALRLAKDYAVGRR
jgi:hypothetical protein